MLNENPEYRKILSFQTMFHGEPIKTMPFARTKRREPA